MTDKSTDRLHAVETPAAAKNREVLARLSRRDIRRAVGERGLELLDQHDEAIRQAHDRLTTLTTDFTQIAIDVVDLGNTLRALIDSVTHLRDGFDTKLATLRGGVNREVDDARMQLGEMDEHVRRLACALQALDRRVVAYASFGARLRWLFLGPQTALGATNDVLGGPGATGPRENRS